MSSSEVPEGNRKKLLKKLLPKVRKIVGRRRGQSYLETPTFALEITELIVFHLGLSVQEIFGLGTKNGKENLEKLIGLVKDINAEYEEACSQGLHLPKPMSPEQYMRVRNDQTLFLGFRSRTCEAYGNKNYFETNPFSIQALKTLEWSWARVEEEGAIDTPGAFRRCFQNAKQVYLIWFSLFYTNGRQAAHAYLRDTLWTADQIECEAEFVEDQVKAYDEAVATLDLPTPPPTHLTTFHGFPRLANELQHKIWNYVFFQPRVVEVQCYITEPSHWHGDNISMNLYDRAFQRVAKNGMRTDMSLNNVFETWHSEDMAQQRMHDATAPRPETPPPESPALPPPPAIKSWENKYIDRLGRIKTSEHDESPLDWDQWEADQVAPAKKKKQPSDAKMRAWRAEREKKAPKKYYNFWSPAHVPEILYVDRASREYALKFYTLGFRNPERPGSGIYVNYDVDEILLDYETWGNNIFYPRDLDLMRGFPEWPAGFREIDDETRKRIKNLSTVVENIHEMYYYRSQLRELFPALDRLSVIYAIANAFYYRLVSDYYIHQVYNRLFPGHTSHFFSEPYIRYLDKPRWFPGLDKHQFQQGMVQHCPVENIERHPGNYPISRPFIQKLLRNSKIEFEEVADTGPKNDHLEAGHFNIDSDEIQSLFQQRFYKGPDEAPDRKELEIRTVHLYRGRPARREGESEAVWRWRFGIDNRDGGDSCLRENTLRWILPLDLAQEKDNFQTNLNQFKDRLYTPFEPGWNIDDENSGDGDGNDDVDDGDRGDNGDRYHNYDKW